MIIYKYRNDDTYSEQILATGTLFFNRPNNQNDPFDSRIPFSFRINMDSMKEYMSTYSKEFESSGLSLDIIEKVCTLFPDWGKLLLDKNEKVLGSLMANSLTQLRNNEEAIRNDFTNRILLSCFSKEYDNVLLWSHYANSHKGVCFGFECNFPAQKNGEPLFAGNKLLVKDIDYRDRLPEIEYFDTQFGNKKALIGLETIYSKKLVWAYEKEIRFLAYNENNEVMEPRCIAFNKNELKELIFGAYFPSDRIENYNRIIKNNGYGSIKLFKMRIVEQDLVKESI